MGGSTTLHCRREYRHAVVCDVGRHLYFSLPLFSLQPFLSPVNVIHPLTLQETFQKAGQLELWEQKLARVAYVNPKISKKPKTDKQIKRAVAAWLKQPPPPRIAFEKPGESDEDDLASSDEEALEGLV